MRPNWYRGWVNAGVALAVFVGCFAFYVFTGPLDIAWGEGADYQRRVALAEIGEGPWDRPLYVLSKESVPGRVLIDAEEAGDVDEPISLVGDWHGYVLPQGYPVSFSITEQSVGAVGADESLVGNVVLNEGGAQSLEGLFTRVSPIGESLVARVTYDEEINIHLDAELVGNRLEGTWLVYEAQYLNGRFRAWRQTPPAPPPGPPDAQ